MTPVKTGIPRTLRSHRVWMLWRRPRAMQCWKSWDVQRKASKVATKSIRSIGGDACTLSSAYLCKWKISPLRLHVDRRIAKQKKKHRCWQNTANRGGPWRFQQKLRFRRASAPCLRPPCWLCAMAVKPSGNLQWLGEDWGGARPGGGWLLGEFFKTALLI